MQQQGKFLLLTPAEFAKWLDGLKVTRTIKLIQNHHTWLPNYSTFNKSRNHFKMLIAMENSHKERGFTQIAQNLTTFPDGSIAVCRPFDDVPAGIKGANGNGICIEHMGNFDTGKDVMAKAHRESIIKINAWLCKKFKLPINSASIVYHHWYDLTLGKRVKEGSPNTKSCPGTDFFGGNTVLACEQNFIPLIKSI